MSEMNKQELLENLKGLRDSYPNDDGHTGIRQGLLIAIGAVEQLGEPEKVVIPKIVAEQLEYWKRNKMNILWQFFIKEIPSSMLSWLESDKVNYDKLIDAEKNGYEVEKLYYVKLPNTNSKSEYLYLAQGNVSGDYWFNDSLERLDYEANACKHKFTEQEIKDYDERYWSFAVEVAE